MEGLGNTGHSECPFLQWFLHTVQCSPPSSSEVPLPQGREIRLITQACHFQATARALPGRISGDQDEDKMPHLYLDNKRRFHIKFVLLNIEFHFILFLYKTDNTVSVCLVGGPPHETLYFTTLKNVNILGKLSIKKNIKSYGTFHKGGGSTQFP